MKEIKKLVLLLLSLVVVASSCKEDDKGDILFVDNGSVSGSIKGVKAGGSELNEMFSFSQYLDYLNKQYYKINANQEYLFYIGFDSKNGSTFNLEYKLSSASDNSPEIVDFHIDVYKTSNNELFEFYMEDTNNTIAITNFSFDATTGNVKGKVIVTGTNNSTSKNATVEGTFDITLKKLVY